MKYTDACKKAVEVYTDGMNAFNDKSDEIEKAFKENDIGAKEYERRRSEIRGTDTALYTQLVQTIYAARDAYIADLPNRYRRDSETMDVADLNLLTSTAANLTPADVSRMFEKHADSLGMQGAIVEYNAKRTDPAPLTYYDEETRENDARTFAEAMINAGRTGGMHAAFAIEGRYVPPSLVNE